MDSQSMLIFLTGVSVRALAIGGLTWACLAVLRVRSAAGRHAVWTCALAGILSLIILNPLLPSLRVPVGRAQAIPSAASADNPAPLPVRPSQSQPSGRLPWKEALAGLYAAAAFFFLTQLFVGYWLTLRLARRSRRVSDDICESDEITVPIAVGVWHPRVLLPVGWREWDQTKLQSVLAHEEAHVQRRDWAILLTAAFTRCLLWFHPLSWWMERHLATLAEQACDDRALLQTGDREGYAQALLDMAQAVRRKQGRIAWQGIAMAKETQVKKRIDQILDDTRHISGALSPARWVALFVLSLPPVYLLTAVQIVPAQAQTQAPTRASEWLQEVSYIITAPEKAAFSNLSSDAERARFIEQFWEQRNPTPGAASNPFKEEFYRRVAYANEHFASNVPGSKTDRGRTYIQHGPPDEIESHPASQPPFDKWRYYHLDGMGDNIDLTFTDTDGTRNYRLSMPLPHPKQ
jgi:GWxTD domain-containing protein